MDPILDVCLYRERVAEEKLLCATLFGMYCVERFDPRVPVTPLPVFWDDLVQGVVPADHKHRLTQLVQLVGKIHESKAAIDTTLPRHEKDPECMWSSSGEGQYVLTRSALVFIEQYVFGMLWPERLAVHTSSARVCGAAPTPDRVHKWLYRVARDMPSSEIEYVCRMTYCAAMTPVTVALQGWKKTSYETYRDYHEVYPIDLWDELIELVARNTPMGLLQQDKRVDATANTSAALAILWGHMRQDGDDKAALLITSGKDIGIHWCDAMSIYFRASECFMCVHTGEIVKPASVRYEDVVFAFVEAMTRHFPANVRMREAMDAFLHSPVDPLLPEWA